MATYQFISSIILFLCLSCLDLQEHQSPSIQREKITSGGSCDSPVRNHVNLVATLGWRDLLMTVNTPQNLYGVEKMWWEW